MQLAAVIVVMVSAKHLQKTRVATAENCAIEVVFANPDFKINGADGGCVGMAGTQAEMCCP